MSECKEIQFFYIIKYLKTKSKIFQNLSKSLEIKKIDVIMGARKAIDQVSHYCSKPDINLCSIIIQRKDTIIVMQHSCCGILLNSTKRKITQVRLFLEPIGVF